MLTVDFQAVVPHSKSRLNSSGRRTFSVVGLVAWNSPSDDLRDPYVDI